MPLSAHELIDAREITAELLDELGLDAYLFEVEPRDGLWEVRIECAESGGWQTLSLDVEREQLLAVRASNTERDAVLSNWRTRLSDCRRASPDA
ncbi:MAG: hypothetical protein WDZ30_12880 [Cellvibrionaceae bacterium]